MNLNATRILPRRTETWAAYGRAESRGADGGTVRAAPPRCQPKLAFLRSLIVGYLALTALPLFTSAATLIDVRRLLLGVPSH